MKTNNQCQHPSIQLDSQGKYCPDCNSFMSDKEYSGFVYKQKLKNTYICHLCESRLFVGEVCFKCYK